MKDHLLEELASFMGCKIASLPSSYLGLPLCPCKVPKSIWNPVLERKEHKLASWKAKYLSFGGRVTLIKATLENLPLYFMSIFKCPTSIIKHIEKFQRDFLWRGKSNKQKFHLVNWSSICKPKKDGGLGFRPLAQMNKALLRKWLWRIGEHDNCLWRQLILAKYRVRRNDWVISGPSYRLPGIWRGIIADKALFTGNIRYKIGSGEDVFFWLDVWLGVRPLAAEFSSLFRCASNQSTKAKDCMEKINDHTIWTPIFKRVLQEDEERELIRLLGVLDQVFVPEEGPDHRI